MDDIINDFNNVTMQFLTELKKLIPGSMILNNLDLIESITKNKQQKKIIIDGFVIYILKYKEQIDNEDEDFFLTTDYTEAQGEFVKIINEVKRLWKDISVDNRKNIFGYFKVLVYYAQEYFDLLDKQ